MALCGTFYECGALIYQNLEYHSEEAEWQKISLSGGALSSQSLPVQSSRNRERDGAPGRPLTALV